MVTLAMSLASDPARLTLNSEHLQSQELTVYQNGHGLVSESYRFKYTSGTMTLHLPQTPDAMNPRSLQAAFSATDIHLLEQRPQGDMLTPRRLTEAAVGGPVTLVFANADGSERLVKGTLLSAREGIVVSTAEGILIQPQGTLRLPSHSESAGSSDGLEWLVEADEGGTAVMDIAYLTGGLGWSADYVVTLAPEKDRASVTVWVSVENNNEVSYQAAHLNLVAGDVRQVTSAPRVRGRLMEAEAMSSRAAPEQDFAQQAVGDVHHYRLDRKIDLPRHGMRQFILDEAASVPVRRRHVVSAGNMFLQNRGPGGQPRRMQVETRLEFTNKKGEGPGRPLPSGVARIFSASEKTGPVFLGEDHLPATAVNEQVSLLTGHSFDLVAERTQTDFQQKTGQRLRYEAAFKYELRNRGEEDVEIDIRDRIPGDWTLLESSMESSRPDSRTLAFRVPVPAGGVVAVSYRIKVD
jgi:hypothetical protein